MEELAEALGRLVEATKVVAARSVAADASDDTAARFCQHHGFRPVSSTMRLNQKLSEVAAALGD